MLRVKRRVKRDERIRRSERRPPDHRIRVQEIGGKAAGLEHKYVFRQRHSQIRAFGAKMVMVPRGDQHGAARLPQQSKYPRRNRRRRGRAVKQVAGDQDHLGADIAGMVDHTLEQLELRFPADGGLFLRQKRTLSPQKTASFSLL